MIDDHAFYDQLFIAHDNSLFALFWIMMVKYKSLFSIARLPQSEKVTNFDLFSFGPMLCRPVSLDSMTYNSIRKVQNCNVIVRYDTTSAKNGGGVENPTLPDFAFNDTHILSEWVSSNVKKQNLFF